MPLFEVGESVHSRQPLKIGGVGRWSFICVGSLAVNQADSRWSSMSALNPLATQKLPPYVTFPRSLLLLLLLRGANTRSYLKSEPSVPKTIRDLSLEQWR
jgi:hypothetical protein